jgi:hypothetical protein
VEEQIPVSIDRIKTIISEKMSETFTTADILREYSGGFYSNIGTPPFFSFNAQFGKLLKRNESELQIKEVFPEMSIKDDNGHKTSTSKWEKCLKILSY